MIWKGILRFSIDGETSFLESPEPETVPDPVRLAIKDGTPTEFIDATNTLVNNHFKNDDEIVVTGRSEPPGAPTLIHMTSVQLAEEAEEFLMMIAAAGGSKKAGAKKAGAKKAGAKKAAKKRASAKSAGAARRGGKKAPAKSATKKSPAKKSVAKKSASKKSAKRAASKGGKKHR